MVNARLIRLAGLVAALCVALPARASTLKVTVNGATVEADYTTTHLFIDEVAGESVSIQIFFDPQRLGVESAEIFTNLNRRERAARDGDGDGVEDGIRPPPGERIAAGDDSQYYRAYPMQLVSGGYSLTLPASRTGAYRLTARYRMNGDAPGTYRWYAAEQNGQGLFKRDHALVISPGKTRALQLYEANPLTILATGTAANQRGTLADMAAGLGPNAVPRFSFAYLKQLGCNTLWLQPFHPRGIDGREINNSTLQPYELGSPYAVKNFFEVMPMMAKSFIPGSTPATDDTPAGRAQAMAEFQGFVQAADQQGIEIMLDAPFNHTAFDVELANPGQQYWGNAGSTGATEIRAVEARVFSRNGTYDARAFNADSIARAPDRFDFPKWADTYDVYFGRYSALVENPGQQEDYKLEEDWFDYSVGVENAAGSGNAHFDKITQSVWRYFADYLSFWLTKTDYPANANGAALNSNAGIDALRADFGQGLPPTAWEYIINRTRTRKWNFVFMAESLDGGAVSYRSARHFDLLNERIIYELHHAQSAQDFQRIFQERRDTYGSALVLLNITSHDEDTYKNPYEGLLRFAVNNSMEGVPMLFPGQELGIRGTVVPPFDSIASEGPAFGYERYDAPFFGKPLPGFKTFNSMMPAWRALAQNEPDTTRLLNLYSGLGQARRNSPALRSGRSAFLKLKNGTTSEQIFAVAKFHRRNADPNIRDVVFAFVNLKLQQRAQTATGNAFNVDLDNDRDGTNDFGIQPERLYNIKNIAAFTGVDPNRSAAWLWGAGRLGRDILRDGIPVQLNALPNNQAGWTTAPYEAQYLKLFDVTPQHAVTTRSENNARTGANTEEVSLTPATVLARGLEKRFSLSVAPDDPRIEAQPLYVPGALMSDGKKHDVLYVFTMSNNIWAFDANSGNTIWPKPVSLGPPFLPAPGDPVDTRGINKSFGILSTPVIDRDAAAMYIANWIVNTQGNRVLQLHARRLSDGKALRPALGMQASIKNAAGQTVTLSQVQKQRAALLLAPGPASHKIVYVAFTGSESPPQNGDASKANHGWILAFDVADWKQTAAWNATPSSFGGGIWQAAQGLAADENGFVYAMTSNGGYILREDDQTQDFTGTSDFPESFVKLKYEVGPTGASLNLVDWFTPFRDAVRKAWEDDEVAPFPSGYEYTDQDLGSGAPLLIPGTDLLLGAGKDGVLYVLDRDKLGQKVGDFSVLKVPPKFFTFEPNRQIAAYQNATATGNLDFKPMQGVKTYHLHGTPVYWNSARRGKMLFVWGENTSLRAYALNDSGKTQLLAHGAELASANLADPNNDSLGGMPGAMLTLSANGDRDGIVWATAPTDGDANLAAVPGIVRAYDASEFAAAPNPDGTPQLKKLWQASGFTYSKFCPPLVADSKLFVPTYDGRVDVYALPSPRVAAIRRKHG